MTFLLSNWKLLAGAGVIAAVFFAGWSANGWRWDSKWNSAIAQHQQDLAELIQKQREEFEAQQSRDMAARTLLTADLAALRLENEELESSVASATLVKTDPEVIIEWRERIIREEIDCDTPILANPFAADFVRLFNQSASRGAGLPGADPSG